MTNPVVGARVIEAIVNQFLFMSNVNFIGTGSKRFEAAQASDLSSGASGGERPVLPDLSRFPLGIGHHPPHPSG
jgi:hypothetical protein